MKKVTLVFASLLLALLGCGHGNMPHTVVVKVDRVVQESARVKEKTREVEDFAKSVEEKLNQMAQELQQAAAEHRRKPEELNYMRAQWESLRQQGEEQVNRRRAGAEEDIHRAIRDAIESLAKEKNWSLVLREDDHAALWADPAMDQTDLVIKRMDTAPPSPKSAQDRPPASVSAAGSATPAAQAGSMR